MVVSLKSVLGPASAAHGLTNNSEADLSAQGRGVFETSTWHSAYRNAFRRWNCPRF